MYKIGGIPRPLYRLFAHSRRRFQHHIFQDVERFGRLAPRPGKRRHFSSKLFEGDDIDFGSSSSSPYHDRNASNNRSSPPPEVALDKFTHYCLNPNMIALGTMTNDTWNDAMEASIAWLQDPDVPRNGYAVDSASRLLDRLWVEYFATDAFNGQDRFETLIELQKMLLEAWMNCAFPNSRTLTSIGALAKTEMAFWRLSEFVDIFPTDEYTALIKACLTVDGSDATNQTQAVEKAAELLIQVVSTASLSSDADKFGPLLENCVIQLLQNNPKSPVAIEMLEVMKTLMQQESGIWSALTIPTEAERVLMDSSLQRYEKDTQTAAPSDEKATTKQVTIISQFEKDSMEKRLIDLLTHSNKSDDELESLIERTIKLDPSSTLVFALIDYYVRLKDVEKSSFWLQQLDDTTLRESQMAVENVMRLWSEQQGDRVKWRADELFKSLTYRMQHAQTGKVSIDLSCIKIMLDMWASSSDPGADRKILELFSNMVAWSICPDEATLNMVLQSVQREKSNSTLYTVSNEILKQWKSLTTDGKILLAEEVMAASVALGGETIETISKLLEKFNDDGIKPTPSVYHSALNAIRPAAGSPSDVLKIVDSFENSLDHIDLSLYTSAYRSLFQFENYMAENEELSNASLHRIKTNIDVMNMEDLSHFLDNVVRMLTYRKQYPAAGEFMKNAENALLPIVGSKSSAQSCPIPLECYKLMIVRKWYTPKTAPAVKRTFEHLMGLYNSGFSSLRPDSDTFTGYMRACSTLGENVGVILQELIDLYKSTGDEMLKPTAESFNIVLLNYSKQNIKKIRAGNKSVKLIDLMLDLGVTPDTKSLNFTLHNLTKGSSQYSFEMAMKLLDTLDEKKCTPEFDSFTLHYILDACAGDSGTSSDVALKTSLSTFRKIREKEMLGPTTYGVLSKVLEQLLQKGDRADKVAGSIFSLCCQDGRLTNEVRERFRSIMSPHAWLVQYERNLATNGEEPEQWSIHAQSESDFEDVA